MCVMGFLNLVLFLLTLYQQKFASKAAISSAQYLVLDSACTQQLFKGAQLICEDNQLIIHKST